MDSKTYFVIELRSVLSEWEDLITSELFENGAAGVQENLQFTQLSRKYKPEVIGADLKNLSVYFEDQPNLVFLENLKSKYQGLVVVVSEHEKKDWLAEWKAEWKPFELTTGVWVVPDWHKESFETKDRKAIYIEPGMAFGTGTHATTQIAAELMMSYFKENQCDSFLDVGTGSGILALLAQLQRIKHIYAYDNDVESKRVFLENLEKNQASNIRWVEPWSTELAGSVDLTLANIIDGVLIDLKPEFQKMKSCHYIFTGILKERENQFLEEMTEAWNIEKKARIEKDEWVGFYFEAQS